MSWPENCVKVADFSSWQGIIDWQRFKDENPEIEQVILRVAGAWNADTNFTTNYAGAVDVGFNPGIYLNNNPAKSADWMMGTWWHPLAGEIAPPLVVLDAETNGWRDSNGVWHDRCSALTVTEQLKEIYDMLLQEWPGAHRWIYSGHWWGENTVHQPWMEDAKFWDPHYIYYAQDTDGTWRVAYHYAEVDRYMPETRDWIPRLPTGISLDKVVAWQITDKGILPGISEGANYTPRCDLNYVLADEYALVWDGSPPVSPEPPISTDVEPTGITLRVLADGLRIRDLPSLSGTITGTRACDDEIQVQDIEVVSATSVWAQDNRGWSAVVHGGTQYMG